MRQKQNDATLRRLARVRRIADAARRLSERARTRPTLRLFTRIFSIISLRPPRVYQFIYTRTSIYLYSSIDGYRWIDGWIDRIGPRMLAFSCETDFSVPSVEYGSRVAKCATK